MPCVGKLAVRRDDIPGTGCRADCLHRRNVEDYRLARQADLEAAEKAAGTPTHHPEEYAEWTAQHPLMDFRTWLEGRRRTGR